MSEIKIIQFKKFSNQNEQDQINWHNRNILNHSSSRINIIFFTQQKPSSKIKYLQDWANDMYSQQIQIYKSFQPDSFDHFIRQIHTTNNNIKTFCIIHESRLRQFSQILIKNQDQQWVKKFNKIGIIYLLNTIQKVNPAVFIIENVRLITLNPQNVEEFIEKEIIEIMENKNVEKSSLDTEQERIFEEEFNKKITKINIKKSYKGIQPLQYVIDKQTPAFGSYNLLPVKQQNSENKRGIFCLGQNRQLFKTNDYPGVGQYSVNSIPHYYNQPHPRIIFPIQNRDSHPERWNQTNIRNFSYNQW